MEPYYLDYQANLVFWTLMLPTVALILGLSGIIWWARRYCKK